MYLIWTVSGNMCGLVLNAGWWKENHIYFYNVKIFTGGIWREHIIHWHNSHIGKQDPDNGLQGKIMAKKMSRSTK